MRILSWLRDAVADFFCVGPDSREREAERNRQELEELRSLTMLAVAQARRTELELRDALAEDPAEEQRLVDLVPRLEEERARASNLMESYREREAQEEERLTRLGQIRMAEEINERRRELRGAIDFASERAREEELAAMEDEARAEAFRLDLLEDLDTGRGFDRQPERKPEEDWTERARRLLEEPAFEPNRDG